MPQKDHAKLAGTLIIGCGDAWTGFAQFAGTRIHTQDLDIPNARPDISEWASLPKSVGLAIWTSPKAPGCYFGSISGAPDFWKLQRIARRLGAARAEWLLDPNSPEAKSAAEAGPEILEICAAAKQGKPALLQVFAMFFFGVFACGVCSSWARGRSPTQQFSTQLLNPRSLNRKL